MERIVGDPVTSAMWVIEALESDDLWDRLRVIASECLYADGSILSSGRAHLTWLADSLEVSATLNGITPLRQLKFQIRLFEAFEDDDDGWYLANNLNHSASGRAYVYEVITFAIHPLRKGGTETEASIALGMAKDVKGSLPGMAMLHYDKAVRGRTVEELWNMKLMPMIGVYDKTGLVTEEVPLEAKTINGIKVNLFAYRGGVCIKASDGSFIPLQATGIAYLPNAGTYRVYCEYVVPEGALCDTRLWGGTFKL